MKQFSFFYLHESSEAEVSGGSHETEGYFFKKNQTVIFI